MKRCNEPTCLRAAIELGAKCDACTRKALTNAFRPEWVRRAEEHRLPVRVSA